MRWRRLRARTATGGFLPLAPSRPAIEGLLGVFLLIPHQENRPPLCCAEVLKFRTSAMRRFSIVCGITRRWPVDVPIMARRNELVVPARAMSHRRSQLPARADSAKSRKAWSRAAIAVGVVAGLPGCVGFAEDPGLFDHARKRGCCAGRLAWVSADVDFGGQVDARHVHSSRNARALARAWRASGDSR